LEVIYLKGFRPKRIKKDITLKIPRKLGGLGIRRKRNFFQTYNQERSLRRD